MEITSLFPRGPGPGRRPVESGADGQAVATVRVLNQQSIAALRTNDAEWFAGNLADDGVIVLGEGRRLRKPEFLSMLRNEPKLYRVLAAQEVTLRAYGNTVQVDADAPCELADGTSSMSHYLATWVHLGGRWQMVSAQVTPLVD
jgi:hypothetical protein